jgi:hypothetical protein
MAPFTLIKEPEVISYKRKIGTAGKAKNVGSILE